MSDQPRTLGGRYVMEEIIGRGGMAQVRRARDTRLGRDVAVKELRVDLAFDSTFQARFRREAQAAAGLNHPNIVSVYDTGEEIDPPTGVSVPYIVMELVEGRTLRDVLREGRPILPERALEFAQGVLDALSFSHKAGIVHRDIKPANVMLTTSGLVKVMDFGIARAVSDTSSTMTQTAAVIGTAQYLSPEQARGETVDARSDVYSCGCLLYELLVGRPPFQGDSPVSVAYQHVREQPVPPSRLDPEVTPAMDAAVLKALAKDPAARYQSAAEMREDITRILAGQSVIASLPAMPPTMKQPTRPGPVATAVLPTASAAPASPSAAVAPSAPDALGLQPATPPRRKRRAVWWSSLAVVVIIALVAGGLLLAFPLGPRVKQVAVPYVFGRPEAIAVQMIEDEGLVASVNRIEGPNDSTVGIVQAQSPQRDTQVAEGSTVTITVNVGPKKLTIPSGLVGRSVTGAREALIEAGFLEGNIRTVEATDEPSGSKLNTVLAVSPIEGTQTTADAQLTLTVATGKARVPYLTGLSQVEAEAEARKYGFTNLTFEPQESSEAEGTVLGTRPGASTLVPKSDPLVVIVAVARPGAETPVDPTTAPSVEAPATGSPVESPVEG